jgi:hypothetical protein
MLFIPKCPLAYNKPKTSGNYPETSDNYPNGHFGFISLSLKKDRDGKRYSIPE